MIHLLIENGLLYIPDKSIYMYGLEMIYVSIMYGSLKTLQWLYLRWVHCKMFLLHLYMLCSKYIYRLHRSVLYSVVKTKFSPITCGHT